MIKTVWGITFRVSDLKKATRFYEEILGLEKSTSFQVMLVLNAEV
jgi:catechol 2,3-dioxygenase-like lactoylglutathione lyase family enzyme